MTVKEMKSDLTVLASINYKNAVLASAHKCINCINYNRYNKKEKLSENQSAISKDGPNLQEVLINYMKKTSNTSMDKTHYQQNSATHKRTHNQTRCLHINLQHLTSTTYNKMKMTEKGEPDVIFIQEPYEYQNRAVRIEKKYRIFTARKGNRAAIVILNNNIDAMLITQISNEDTAFLEIIHGNIKFFAASMYFNIEHQIENNFTKIDAPLQFAKGGRILKATDSNSRSTT
jgi:hypothetical protein